MSTSDPMTSDRAEILEELTKILVETRGVDEDECTLDATLFGGLGLESIDVIEISFRIEESWGFPYPTDDLGVVMNSVGEDSTPEDARRALDTLRDDFFMEVPDAVHLLGDPLQVDQLRRVALRFFTVESLVRFVEAKLAAREV